MLLAVGLLPSDPPAAAAAFHAEVLPRILAALKAGEPCLTLAFEPAPHAHAAWRLAAVQTIAAARPPARVNAVAGGDAEVLAATAAFLASASGITGQYLVLADAPREA